MGLFGGKIPLPFSFSFKGVGLGEKRLSQEKGGEELRGFLNNWLIPGGEGKFRARGSGFNGNFRKQKENLGGAKILPNYTYYSFLTLRLNS